MKQLRLLIITPLLPPAVGGGGVYTQLLVKGLMAKPEVSRIVILTETYPGCPTEEVLFNGRLHIKRVFPYRAGVVYKDTFRYLKYIYQNLQFFLAHLVIRRYKITHVLIHASFHNKLSSMSLVVRTLKKIPGIQLVADVRDLDLLPSRVHKLYHYDKVICCSENIYNSLIQDTILKKVTTFIPVIVDVKVPTLKEINDCKQKYKLLKKNYIINSSGISEEKGINLLIDMVAKIREMSEDVILVVAGKSRDWSRKHQVAVDAGLLVYLGPISHADVLCLSAGSCLDINLSKVDSMPRASLEAIAVGAKVILPPGVPELVRSCSENVSASDQPDELATQAISLLRQDNYHLNYDISVHSLEKVVLEYIQVLN